MANLPCSFPFLHFLHRSSTWGIVKIMVPFWVPIIVRGLILGTQKGTIILTIPHFPTPGSEVSGTATPSTVSSKRTTASLQPLPDDKLEEGLFGILFYESPGMPSLRRGPALILKPNPTYPALYSTDQRVGGGSKGRVWVLRFFRVEVRASRLTHAPKHGPNTSRRVLPKPLFRPIAVEFVGMLWIKS